MKLSRFRAIREVVRTTWAEGGARGFYVGLAPGLFGPTVAWGSYMVAYARPFSTKFIFLDFLVFLFVFGVKIISSAGVEFLKF
jgi:hypothetical protein